MDGYYGAPDPYSSFTRGLLGGLATYRGLAEMKQQRLEQEEERKQKQMDMQLRLLSSGIGLLEKDMPTAIKHKYLSGLFDFAKEHFPESSGQIAQMLESTSMDVTELKTFGELSKKVKTILTGYVKGDIDLPTTMMGLQDSSEEFRQKLPGELYDHDPVKAATDIVTLVKADKDAKQKAALDLEKIDREQRAAMAKIAYEQGLRNAAPTGDMKEWGAMQADPEGFGKYMREKPSGVNINLGNLTEKIGVEGRAKDEAMLLSTQGKEKAFDFVKNLYGPQYDDLNEQQRSTAAAKVMDSWLKERYPDKNIQFGKGDKGTGWYEIDASGNAVELVRPWVESR